MATTWTRPKKEDMTAMPQACIQKPQHPGTSSDTPILVVQETKTEMRGMSINHAPEVPEYLRLTKDNECHCKTANHDGEIVRPVFTIRRENKNAKPRRWRNVCEKCGLEKERVIGMVEKLIECGES